jgi:hypothetical protein
MDEFFAKLAVDEEAEFYKNELEWWNGHNNLPLITYQLKYKYLSAKVNVEYEFRQSEFSRPSAIDGGIFSDRHNYQVRCEIITNKKYPILNISERGVLVKLLKPKSYLNFNVKCIDKKLKSSLQQNLNLKNIFTIVENSAEFSPLIIGKMKEGYYELNVMYNTQQKNENSLKLINDFCTNLVEYWNEEKTIG